MAEWPFSSTPDYRYPAWERGRMKRQSPGSRYFSGMRNLPIGGLMVFFLLTAVPSEALSDLARDLAGCAQIEDPGERLKCYDHLGGRQTKEPAPAKGSAEKPPQESGQDVFLLFPAVGTGPGHPQRKILHLSPSIQLHPSFHLQHLAQCRGRSPGGPQEGSQITKKSSFS